MIINYKDRYEKLVSSLGYEVDKFDDIEDFEKLTKVAAFLLKVKTAFMTSKPEKTGALFITGISGEKDDMGLPEYISVCPTYGLDVFYMYKKDTEYPSPDN